MQRVGIIAVLVLFLDQLTKWLVIRYVSPSQPLPIVDGFFQLVHWRNPGAAWGILRDYNLLLALISIATVLALYLFRHSFGIERSAAGWALGLISGGIFGNLMDRIRLGSVVDFLDFSIAGYHWPAFNIADSAICIGVILYIFVSGRNKQ